MAGYSGTSLVKKLGLAVGKRTYVEAAPDGYLTLLEPLPENIEFRDAAQRSV